MRNHHVSFVAVIAGALGIGFQANAASRSERGHFVGSGIAYPGVSHALFVNPASLTESPKMSLQGEYLIDPSKVGASLTSGGGAVGFGIGYRQVSSGAVEEAGLAGRVGMATFGALLSTRDFDGLDADIGANFDFSKARLSVLGRAANGGFDRLDAGLGVMTGPVTFEFDVKKPLPMSSNAWSFDAGFAVGDSRLSAGAGYTFYYAANQFIQGTLHAGLSFGITNGFAVEAFYRPETQERSAGDWVLGARVEL